MKFTLTREQRHFFQEKGFIEFDEFITEKQIDAINMGIDVALPSSHIRSSAEQQFLQGRDLWRRTESLRKWACQPLFGQIISELTLKTPIRLGFDQLLPGITSEEPGIYHDFMNKTSTLEECCCIKGIQGGLLLCLSSGEGERTEQDLFPLRAGSAVFIGPSTPWDRTHLFHHADQRYYLIVYTESLAWYQLQPGDPHTHDWKKFGYVLNEKLISPLHPIVYR